MGMFVNVILYEVKIPICPVHDPGLRNPTQNVPDSMQFAARGAYIGGLLKGASMTLPKNTTRRAEVPDFCRRRQVSVTPALLRRRLTGNSKFEQTNPFRHNPMCPFIVQRIIFSFPTSQKNRGKGIPRKQLGMTDHFGDFGHTRDSKNPAPCGKMNKRTHFPVIPCAAYSSNEFFHFPLAPSWGGADGRGIHLTPFQKYLAGST